jgi:hypothetical protein
VVVAAGLNYSGHAEEAGGGDVFVFPKPVEPTGPYSTVSAPTGVTLLDYEVELAFVLLADVSLAALPTWETLLDQSAFFVANDVTDREAIIRNATFTGPGTGSSRRKGNRDSCPRVRGSCAGGSCLPRWRRAVAAGCRSASKSTRARASSCARTPTPSCCCSIRSRCSRASQSRCALRVCAARCR